MRFRRRGHFPSAVSRPPGQRGNPDRRELRTGLGRRCRLAARADSGGCDRGVVEPARGSGRDPALSCARRPIPPGRWNRRRQRGHFRSDGVRRRGHAGQPFRGTRRGSGRAWEHRRRSRMRRRLHRRPFPADGPPVRPGRDVRTADAVSVGRAAGAGAGCLRQLRGRPRPTAHPGARGRSSRLHRGRLCVGRLVLRGGRYRYRDRVARSMDPDIPGRRASVGHPVGDLRSHARDTQ